jgi:hypothetical protein
MLLRNRLRVLVLGGAVAVLGGAAQPAAAQYHDPNPPPADPPASTITLTANKTDVTFRQRVILRGKIDPAPGDRHAYVEIAAQTIPEEQYDDPVHFGAKLSADGTFAVSYRPSTNKRFTATVRYQSPDAESTSAPVTVFADYGLRTYWRRVRGGLLELAMLIRAPSGTGYGMNTFPGRTAWFYGFHRGDRFARRLVGLRMFSTDPESSNGRAGAYAKRRLRAARGIQFMFACVPEPRPDVWGRPTDPIQRRCGHRRLRLPTR